MQRQEAPHLRFALFHTSLLVVHSIHVFLESFFDKNLIHFASHNAPIFRQKQSWLCFCKFSLAEALYQISSTTVENLVTEAATYPTLFCSVQASYSFPLWQNTIYAQPRDDATKSAFHLSGPWKVSRKYAPCFFVAKKWQHFSGRGPSTSAMYHYVIHESVKIQSGLESPK